MTTSNKLITFEAEATRIGVPPTLFPRPNAKYKNTLQVFSRGAPVDPLLPIPTFWVHGFVTMPKEYALTGEPPWVDYADPGFH